MRKTIIASNGYALAAEQILPDRLWLDLEQIASIEISSENKQYPVEQAFARIDDESRKLSPGWRANMLGPQTLCLRFDHPQKIKRVLLHFHETEQERSQEFSLEASLVGDRTHEIVRQQWSFSPGGSTEEKENYLVNLEEVTALTLWIDPDRGRDRYYATLAALRVEGS